MPAPQAGIQGLITDLWIVRRTTFYLLERDLCHRYAHRSHRALKPISEAAFLVELRRDRHRLVWDGGAGLLRVVSRQHPRGQRECSQPQEHDSGRADATRWPLDPSLGFGPELLH
jgi:hypothetical protein